MGSSLKVRFGDPLHGWMSLSMQSDTHDVRLNMSHVLFDTLTDLVECLHAMNTGDDERSVQILEEPKICVLHFRRAAGDFEINAHRNCQPHQHELVLRHNGGFADVCMPFWRALRDLQVRAQTQDFVALWRRPFPELAMEKLSPTVGRSK